MKAFILAPFLSALVLSPLAHADEGWCHARFESTNGTVIRLDYSPSLTSTTRGATPFVFIEPWFHVKAPALIGTEAVQLVLVKNGEMLQKLDLAWSGSAGDFSGKAYVFGDGLWHEKGDKPQIDYDRFEFAVVVDGKWLKDPIYRNSDFSVDLGARPGSCDQQ